MSVTPVNATEMKQGIEFSTVSDKFIRVAEWIMQHAKAFFALIASGVTKSPLKYMMTLRGPKKALSATLSISLKRLAELLPFQMWAPKLSINITCKFNKI